MATAIKNALTISRITNPAFSGVNGQIDHRGGPATMSGQKVSEEGALRVAACWIATSLIADEIAALKCKLIKRDDKTRTPQRPKSLQPLWGDNPNPDQTRIGVEATETLSMLLWGFSATMLGWTRAGELDVRWPIDPSTAALERTERGGLCLKSPKRDPLVNEPNERPQFEFTPWLTLPGQLMPVSPVRLAAERLGLAMGYEETAARLMGRGMNPSAVITLDEKVADDDARALSGRLEQLYGGAGKAGGYAVMGGKGLKLDRLTMSMADAEFIAQNKQVFELTMAMWRVPPTVAGMVDKPSTWGTGIAEFTRGLERFTLRPHVERREASKQKHITQWAAPDLQVKYPFDSMLSASPRERTEIQARRIQSGLTSVERVLAQEDEPPFDADETVFSPLAMATTEDRRLQSLSIRAETYGALIRAGVDPDAAAEETGFNPAELRHTGRLPVTVQAEE